MALDDTMEFYQVVYVHEDETVHTDISAPELYVEAHWDEYGDPHILSHHEDALMNDARSQGWELMTGWTGQQGYSGPCMHPSEYIGGRLEEHIRENPGYYVCLPVTIIPPDSDAESTDAGWAIAYRS